MPGGSEGGGNSFTSQKPLGGGKKQFLLLRSRWGKKLLRSRWGFYFPFWGWTLKFEESRHAQMCIHVAFHEESDFEVKNKEIQRLEMKNQEKRN